LYLNISNLDVEVEGRGTVGPTGLEEEGVALEGGAATEREEVGAGAEEEATGGAETRG